MRLQIALGRTCIAGAVASIVDGNICAQVRSRLVVGVLSVSTLAPVEDSAALVRTTQLLRMIEHLRPAAVWAVL